MMMAMPTHVFKIVVCEGAAGALKAIAFVAANKKPATGWRFSDGIVAVFWLELRAGLNFMPELDPGAEIARESKPSPMWGQ